MQTNLCPARDSLTRKLSPGCCQQHAINDVNLTQACRLWTAYQIGNYEIIEGQHPRATQNLNPDNTTCYVHHNMISKTKATMHTQRGQHERDNVKACQRCDIQTATIQCVTVLNNCNMHSSATLQDAWSVRDNSKHESSADPNPNATTCYIQYMMI